MHMETNTNQSSGNCMTRYIETSLRIYQENIEGLSRSKWEVLFRILHENNITIVIIQETHIYNKIDLKRRGKLTGFEIVGATYHRLSGRQQYRQ